MDRMNPISFLKNLDSCLKRVGYHNVMDHGVAWLSLWLSHIKSMLMILKIFLVKFGCPTRNSIAPKSIFIPYYMVLWHNCYYWWWIQWNMDKYSWFSSRLPPSCGKESEWKKSNNKKFFFNVIQFGPTNAPPFYTAMVK